LQACDTLAEKGFKLLATCCSGANGLVATQGAGPLQQEFITQRNTGEFEEQRWAHYTEYVFYREALCSGGLSPLPCIKAISPSS
uniref:Methyltranfer_dom domain-containing protein n=1 Tax=Gongylonema pulchrum TaxID=637853 RepID=A0A183DWR1_9BILA